MAEHSEKDERDGVLAVRLGYKKLKEEYSKWFMEGSGDTATKNVAL